MVMVVVVVDPTPPTCCQQSPAPEIMWQPAVSPPRWQGKAPLCRDSSRGPDIETMVMVSDGITKDGMSNSNVVPCGVRSLRVKANSVLCLQRG